MKPFAEEMETTVRIALTRYRGCSPAPCCLGYVVMVVGPPGTAPGTSKLSVWRSNYMSYGPVKTT